MRYTEARLSRISLEMTADLNKDTVDFIPNFWGVVYKRGSFKLSSLF